MPCIDPPAGFAADALLKTALLVVQMLCTLGIAYAAVFWALGRHKSEKIWEQQLSAYSDCVHAVDQLRRNAEGHLKRMQAVSEGGRTPPDTPPPTIAARTLSEVIATAKLLLPDNTLDTLLSLETDLNRESTARDVDDAVREAFDSVQLLDRTAKLLAAQGREFLEIADRKRGG